jgi:hypothetical protein
MLIVQSHAVIGLGCSGHMSTAVSVERTGRNTGGPDIQILLSAPEVWLFDRRVNVQDALNKHQRQ